MLLLEKYARCLRCKAPVNGLLATWTLTENLPALKVMVGHDPSVLAALEVGLDGAIAASANILPDQVLGIAAAFGAGDCKAAEGHLAKLNEWCALIVLKAFLGDTDITGHLSSEVSFGLGVR